MDVEEYRKSVEKEMRVNLLKEKVVKSLKDYSDEREDMRFEKQEIFHSIVSGVKEVKETIDEKQDRLIEKLTENQKAITSGLENLIDERGALATPSVGYQLTSQMTPSSLQADIDKNFSLYEVQRLADYNLPPPSDVMKAVINKTLDWNDYDRKLSKQIQTKQKIKTEVKSMNCRRISSYCKSIEAVYSC